MPESKTTRIETQEEPAQWLAGPPPPPPAGGGEGDTARDRGLAGHTPLSSEALRSATGHLRAESPWMIASAGVVVALAAYWAASVVSAFEHGQSITGQERALRVFAPGTFVWVLGAIVAVALYSSGRRFEVPASRPAPIRVPLAMALVLAGAAAVASAIMSILVELANFGNGIASSLAGLLTYVGTLVLAASLAWWTNREHEVVAAGRR